MSVARLLVDLGNTRLKWAWREAGTWQRGEAVHGGHALTEVLEDAWSALARPAEIVTASVAAPAVRQALTAWVAKRWGRPVRFIQAQAQLLDVRNGYRDPSTLGADRWAALIGARDLTKSAACVVDCGTAVTVDALSAEGVFLGGVIFPGLRLLREGLLAGTAGVREATGAETGCLGRSTGEAVAGGTLFGLCGAIERFLAEQQGVLGGAPTVFLTGGDAALVAPHLRRPVTPVPDLVLRGLERIAEALP